LGLSLVRSCYALASYSFYFFCFFRRQFTDAMTFQVFDLSVVKPSDFVHYGLSCLERLADQGDNCAKAAREKIRIVVAGGDGTVGWMLGCLSDLYKMKREPVPPTGIIPLGTGNDLARSFGWVITYICDTYPF